MKTREAELKQMMKDGILPGYVIDEQMDAELKESENIFSAFIAFGIFIISLLIGVVAFTLWMISLIFF